MKTLIRANLKAHTARLMAASVAVVLSVGFIVAALTLHTSFLGALKQQFVAPIVNANLVVAFSEFQSPLGVDSTTDHGTDVVAAAKFGTELMKLPGVTAAHYSKSSGYSIIDAVGVTHSVTLANQPSPAFLTQKLATGTWPTGNSIVLTDRDAKNLKAKVGDKLTLGRSETTESPALTHVTVSGILQPVDAMFPENSGYISQQLLENPATALPPMPAVVQLKTSGDVAQLKTEVTALATAFGQKTHSAAEKYGSGVPTIAIYTPDEKVEQQLTAATGQTAILLSFGLLFGFISIFVAALVISNIFSVIVAQRVRELALLRSIGARRKDIRAILRSETYAVGIIGGIGGILLGWALAYLVIAISKTVQGIPLIATLPPWYSVVIGLFVGILVTVIAGSRPLRHATKVSPLAAMRSSDAEVLGLPKAGTKAFLIGFMFLAGVTGMVLGAKPPEVLSNIAGGGLLAAMSGGALIFIAVLLGLGHVIPQITGVVGRALARGPASQIAAQVAVRNPRRITAVSGAILIGVTLVAMFIVGAATAKTSIIAEMDTRNPVDVYVTQPELNPKVIPLIQRSGVVASTLSLRGTAVTPEDDVNRLEPALKARVDAVANGQQVPATALVVMRENQFYPVFLVGATAADLATFSRARDKPALADGVVYLSAATLRDQFDSGKNRSAHMIRIVTATGAVHELPYVISRVPYQQLVVNNATLERLAPRAGTVAAWFALKDGLTLQDANDFSSTVQSQLYSDGMQGTLTPQGTMSNSIGQFNQEGIDRQMYILLIDVLLLVVLALLATSVIISIVGVSNTMSLSVIERRRELSLLRAVGMTRRQVRSMVICEAVLISAFAALLGVVLGTGFGVLGTASVLPSSGNVPLLVDIPWWQIGAAVLVMMVASTIAGLAPARRASRTSPVRGISEFV